jgi:5-methylcytosine-specific restriction protein B
MTFSHQSYSNFSSEIVAANGFSKFKIEFFNTGTFVQVTNSTGKAHDVSFQSVLATLNDIKSSQLCQDYIEYCHSNPALVLSDIQHELNRFNSFKQQRESGALAVAAMTKFKYFEKPIRVIGKELLSDDRAKVIAAEQTKILFNVLSRLVHIANGLNQFQHPTLDEEVTFSPTELNNTIDYIKELIEFSHVLPIAPSSTINGKNMIYYGAPGTGKSHIIKEQTASYKKITTVFHPDTQYSDFVGSLKPQMEEDSNDPSKRQITYQFRPGPFSNALIAAILNENEHVFLVIEEINRAPAAAVFGELFQLLDRQNGASKYEIDAADPDMLDYINNHLSDDKVIKKLTIPANLSLLATMNSSDQAVMPMDAAFKRRWSFKYIRIDFDNIDVPSNKFRISTAHGTYDISWSDFAQIINKTLIECHVAEDRLLGPFFLTKDEMADMKATKDTLSDKLFVYLWDDVLRHLGHDHLFSPTYKTFGDLSYAFHEDKAVFNSSIEEEIESRGEKVITAESQGESAGE